jgi:hypothetical protein
MEKIEVTQDELSAALTEWDRRYRENPDEFWSETERLAGSPESYGAAAAPYLVSILREQGVVAEWIMPTYRIACTCQVSADGEDWRATLFVDDVERASISGSSNRASAEQAGEFLLLGARREWSTYSKPSHEALTAGAEAMNAPRHIDPDYPDDVEMDEQRVASVIRAVEAFEYRRLMCVICGGCGKTVGCDVCGSTGFIAP